MNRMKSKWENLRETFSQNGQQHVFRYLDELDEDRRTILFGQLASFDLSPIRREVLSLRRNRQDLGILKPASCLRLPASHTDELRWKQARARGERLLSDGKVAVITVAGGQGTRLGFEHSKGLFQVTPVRNKSLFQLFAEKIHATENRHQQPIHWFILTSHINHEETIKFFSENNFFGLKYVHIHPQGLLPTVDCDGRLLLSAKYMIAMHPDGHGGLLRTLGTSGVMDVLQRAGVEHLSYHQVDNPLVHPLDPTFIGFHDGELSQVSSRCVRKAYADEKVGVFVESDGKLKVVEYSDLPCELAHSVDISDRLRFGLANIATHLFRLDFIEPFTREENWNLLPLHRAEKRVPHINENGRLMRPAEPNAIKLERFIFDLLPLASRTLLLEGKREEIFSPVKNLTGLDSLETSKRDQIKLFAQWLSEANSDIPMDAEGLPPFALEISPLFGDFREEFLRHWSELTPKPVVRGNFYLE